MSLTINKEMATDMIVLQNTVNQDRLYIERTAIERVDKYRYSEVR